MSDVSRHLPQIVEPAWAANPMRGAYRQLPQAEQRHAEIGGMQTEFFSKTTELSSSTSPAQQTFSASEIGSKRFDTGVQYRM